MKEILMMTGARTLVEVCAGVQPHETVLIVTDPECYEVAHILAAAVYERGPKPIVIAFPPNELDGQEPPPLVARAMKEADVIFTPVRRSISHSAAVREALENGARVVSLTAFTKEQLYTGGIRADFLKEKARCDRAAQMFTQARQLHLTSRGGTNLRVDISGRRGNSHACVVRNPGEFTAVPNIEANVAPVEGSAEGVVVVDGSIPNFDIGLVTEPIRLTVRSGRIVDIAGGRQARTLDRILRSLGSEAAYNIAQVAVGLNPECKEVTGVFLNDHGAWGRVHIGIGTSENLGGATRAPIHFDVVIESPTLLLDGKPLVKDGEVLLD